MTRLTRRRLLGAVPALGLGATALHAAIPHSHGSAAGRRARHGHGRRRRRPRSDGHAGFRGGEVDHRANGFDPHVILRDFDEGKVSRLPNGRTLREWTIAAAEQEIEVAPGVKFAAWSYNGRIPGPTLRATEGDRLRIRFVNGGRHPHTMHFHGIHPAELGRRRRPRRRATSRRAARRSTSSTPRRSACTSTTATCARSPSTSPRACTARS